MSFKKIRGIRLPYERQGLIYFTLRNYRYLEPEVRAHIDSLITEAARGEALRAEVLRRWLLRGDIDGKRAATEAYCSENTMYRARTWVYEHF